MKIIINLQSWSDIITNSSSELFATITSEDGDISEEIYHIIDSLFGWNQEYELTPVVSYIEDTKNIEIDLPYRLDTYKTFYKEGFKALLDEKIGKDNYKIIYNEEF